MSEEMNKHFRIASMGQTQEEVTPEVSEETQEVAEEQVEEQETQVEQTTQEEVVEQTEAEESQPEPIIEKVKKKVNVPYKEFIEANKDVLKQYLNSKETDYSAMDNLEAVKLKVQKDNPTWTKQEVEDALNDRYSLDLKNADPDTLSEEELRQIKKAERDLKTDALKAKQFLEESKLSDEALPEFEYEFEDEVETSESKDNLKTQEDYEREAIEYMQEHREKVWVPAIKQTLDTQVSSITEEVEYELDGNKGVIKVDYKLSPQEKESVLSELSDYIAKPSDNKYVNETDGSVNYKGFVEDKTREIIAKKILKSAVKEAMAIARESLVKKQINFSEEVRSVDIPDETTNEMDFLRKAKGRK